MPPSQSTSPRPTVVQVWKRQLLRQCISSDDLSQRHVQGLLLILCVALIWIAASFLVQALMATGQGHEPMHPFVLTYICNSLFLLYVVIAAWQVKRSRQDVRRSDSGVPDDPTPPADGPALQPVCFARDVDVADTRRASAFSLEDADTTSTSDRIKLLGPRPDASDPDNWQIARAALAVAPLWFFAQLCFNYSLLFTSVTSNTVLSSPSSLFTFLLSVIVLGERFSVGKLFAVVLTIAGTIIVAAVDAYLNHESGGLGHIASRGVLGDVLALLAAVFYACYTITLRVMLPEDAEGSMTTFFGYLGVINFVGFLPVLIILQLSGRVSLMSIGALPLALAFIKGLFDNALSDYLWARAILLVGPTIATVGLSIQVPIAMLIEPMVHADGWWSRTDLCLMEITGALCILCGFFAVSVA